LLKSELNETRATREECEGKLECCEEEVQVWKGEAKRQKADTAKMNRWVERFAAQKFCNGAEIPNHFL